MALAASLLLASSAHGQKKPQTGAFVMRCSKVHKLGSMKEQTRRFGWSKDMLKKEAPNRGHYVVGQESWQVYVPPTYDKKKPHGVLVWIHAGSSGAVPKAWHGILEKHRMIAVGANRSGNQRKPWFRNALALDGLQEILKRYRIDKDRVFVSGFSGGGRAASQLAMHYPDVFRGGIYQGGVDHFSDVTSPDGAKTWPAVFGAPGKKLLGLARKRSRHVAIAGSKCKNRDQCEATTFAWKAQGFAHVEWIEMPDQGHIFANAEAMSEALAALR